MTIISESVEDYLSKVQDAHKNAVNDLLSIVRTNIPAGFEECISYNMIGFVVPHFIYPAGYHCSPKLPLPFINIASQKNFVAFYHMGIYASKPTYDWFMAEYDKLELKKLDAGKSCFRFKKYEDIPFDLIGKLVAKFSVQDWIQLYEANFLKK